MQFGVLLLLFFFGGDESYKSHSPIIKEETIDAISSFLQRGCEELGIKRVSIYFHGGEPLLMKHHLFEYACLSFKNKLEKILDSLLLSVQTNALLVNKEWVGLFEKYSIRVGVSIDGFKEHHDKFRIDHKGRGSYDKTVEKIKYLQGFEKQGKATPHDGVIARKLAYVLSGGNTSIHKPLTETDLLALELEAFMELIKTRPTLDRLEHMLETGKPLRN